MKKKIILVIIVLIIIAIFFIINKKTSTGKIVNTPEIKIVPLVKNEREKIIQSALSSEFIKNIPEKYPVYLQIYSFENGQKIWRDGFLIGKNKFLSKGEPGISLTLNSKYISELNQTNLCEIVKKANNNGDLGYYSKYNQASLFIKYIGLLKYKKCLGF